MTEPPGGPWLAPELVSSPVWVCSHNRRKSYAFIMLTCRSCAWTGREDDAADDGSGTPSLFDGQEPHSAQECAQRQADPRTAERDSWAARRTLGLVHGPFPED